MTIQHFILTRFNVLLWRKAKDGNPVRTRAWLEHRFAIFERYCLPSVMGQTCKDFQWLVLFDSTTPEIYRERVERYRKMCPQFVPVYVEPREGRNFAQIFRIQVAERLHADRVVTTYFDNDDALHTGFVEDVQRRAKGLPDGTFINYNHGYQLYTDYNYVMRIHYPTNHFQSVVESAGDFKTVFGYGSHAYIHKIKGVRIENVKNVPMWCENVHERNMANDAYFIRGVRMMKDPQLLRRDFGLDVTVSSGPGLLLLRFLPRYARTFMVRVKYFFFGRHW